MQFASVSEAIQEWAWNVGHERPDCAWICSDYDTWERNPYYQGPPVEHPEVEAEMAAQEADRMFWQNSDGVDMVWFGQFDWLHFNRFDDFAGCRASGCVVEMPEEIPF